MTEISAGALIAQLKDQRNEALDEVAKLRAYIAEHATEKDAEGDRPESGPRERTE